MGSVQVTTYPGTLHWIKGTLGYSTCYSLRTPSSLPSTHPWAVSSLCRFALNHAVSTKWLFSWLLHKKFIKKLWNAPCHRFRLLKHWKILYHECMSKTTLVSFPINFGAMLCLIKLLDCWCRLWRVRCCSEVEWPRHTGPLAETPWVRSWVSEGQSTFFTTSPPPTHLHTHAYNIQCIYSTGGPWLVTDMRRGESLFELDLTAQVPLLQHPYTSDSVCTCICSLLSGFLPSTKAVLS